MAISEEDLFYLSKKAEAPYFEDSFNFYTGCINDALKKLEDLFPDFSKNSVKIYIQGSYENQTMVDDFSKLELVVEFALNSFGELKKNPVLKTKTVLINGNLIKKRVVNFKPIIPIPYIKRVILETVIEKSGNDGVFNNSKSITIPAHKKHKIPCEILPSYSLTSPNDYGVIIWDASIQKYVAAFPVLHCKNLREKNELTEGNFIKIVRIYRNIRDIMIQNEIIDTGFAPSYFLECLLYNIPNELFTNSLDRMMLKILNYLRNCNLSQFVCVHEQFQMFGNNSDTWTTNNARLFIEVMINIWMNYDVDDEE